ncbi:MAG: AI-2E family transporter [Deltaproteobacteria bacterium]|nr:AI-2E family transporter [Deltaproteobacteria bacterium]
MDKERQFINSPSTRRWLLIGGFVLTIALAYALRRVLVPLLLAFLIAYALDPLVDRLERIRVPRSLGAVAVVLGLILILTTVLVIAVPIFTQQFTEATATIPQKAVQLRDKIEPWIWTTFHYKVPRTPGEMALKAFEALRSRGLDVVDSLTRAVFSTVQAIVLSLSMLIIPVFTIYLLIDFNQVVERASKLVPRRFYPAIAAVARDIHATLGHYIRGQITANLLLATLYGGGLYMVGLPLGVPIGVFTGMLAFVPYIGFGIGFLLAMSLAILEFQGVWHVLGVIAVMGLVQLLDAFIITPRVVGGAVGLKPIEVLLTMMAAGTLFGFVGVLLAVPIGAVIKIVLHHAVQAYFDSDYYRQSMPPPARVPSKPD